MVADPACCGQLNKEKVSLSPVPVHALDNFLSCTRVRPPRGRGAPHRGRIWLQAPVGK